MAEILDEIEVKNNRKSFSKLSLINSLITLGLVVYLFSSIPKTIKASEGLPEPPMIIVIATQLLCLTGIIMVILSFKKKEPSNWFKWTGAILNIVLFVSLPQSLGQYNNNTSLINNFKTHYNFTGSSGF